MITGSNEPVQAVNSKIPILQNLTQNEFQVYQHVEQDEGMKIDTLLVAVHGRKRRKSQKTRRKTKPFEPLFSLVG